MSVMVTSGGKRYCTACGKLQPSNQFERAATGEPKRDCVLHGKGEEDRDAVGQRFCVVCVEMRPLEEFAVYHNGRTNKVCRRHDDREESTFMPHATDGKRCIRCKETKPLDEFRLYRYGGTSRTKQECKGCEGGGSTALAVRPGAEAARTPPSHLATNGTYKKLFSEQQGRCAVCGQQECARDEIGQVLPLSLYGAAHYDRRVQGLLCKLCNMGLSMFRDSPALLGSAISFLTRKVPSAEGDVRMVRHD